MISKETQYRIYAGTRKDDYTGWEKVDVDPAEDDNIDFWSLNLGNGYFLDRVTKNVRGLLGVKRIKFNSVRRDRSIEDPDGEYRDMDLNILFDVDQEQLVRSAVHGAHRLGGVLRRGSDLRGPGDREELRELLLLTI